MKLDRQIIAQDVKMACMLGHLKDQWQAMRIDILYKE